MSLTMETELMRHRVFLTSHAFYVFVFNSMAHFPFWAHMCVVAPSTYCAWLVFHRAVGFWQTSMVIYGFTVSAFVPVVFIVYKERLHWQRFQSIRQLDRERQNLEITQAALQHEKDSSESMCQELAAEKSGSEALMTKLKAEKQALEALLGMICDASFWLADDGDTVVKSERRFDAVMGCNMLEQSLLSHFPSSEHERLKRAVCVEDVGEDSPVRLLTTVVHQGISAVKVDLLIVDRRHSSDLSIGLGYLVGLRL
jgi:hypothetical protein